MDLTKEQYEGWKVHPATKAVFAEFKKTRDALKESLASGDYCFPESATHTAMKTAQITGRIEGLDDLLKDKDKFFEPEDFEEGEEE